MNFDLENETVSDGRASKGSGRRSLGKKPRLGGEEGQQGCQKRSKPNEKILQKGGRERALLRGKKGAIRRHKRTTGVLL